jgi:hypothetical protein
MSSVTRNRLAALVVYLLALSALPVAAAADLGGDCCADLEARVAALEASTVRKFGSRLSITLSGYVAKQAMAWDDGKDSATYIADIGPTQATNFRIGGQAKIAPGWTAGFMLRLQDLSTSTMGLSQFVATQQLGLNTQLSNWFIASEDYGRITMGRQPLASKSAAMFTDLSGTQLIANYVLFDGPGFSAPERRAARAALGRYRLLLFPATALGRRLRRRRDERRPL